MKKTKLFTSLAALALVLSLGACNNEETGDDALDGGGNPGEHIHEYEVTDSKDATCVEDGYITYTCKDGDDTYTETIPALGHDWDNSNATSNENGTHTIGCTRCDATTTENCEYGDWTDSGEGTHYKACIICGSQATGDDDGEHQYEYVQSADGHYQVCTVCGASTSVENHTLVQGYDDTYHYQECSVCGYINESTKTSHSLSEEYEADDTGHYHLCECGYKGDFSAHGFENTEFGPLANGYQHGLGTCETCGYESAEVHQVISNENPTCSVCGAQNLNVVGLEYTVSNVEATVKYTGTAAVGDVLFVPANYSDGSNSYPVTKTATASGGSTSNGSLGGAAAYYKYIGLPEGLVEIGNYSFDAGQNNSALLEAIEIPSTVTTIGTYVFAYCKALKSVTFADGEDGPQIESFGNYVFRNCTSLESMIFPSNATFQVGTNAFNSCTSLKYVDLGGAWGGVSTSAYDGCTSLEEIIIPEGITGIESNAFNSCSSLESVIIPDTVTAINGSFQKCSGLKWAILGSGIQSLGYQAFRDSSEVTKIESIYYRGTETMYAQVTKDSQAIPTSTAVYYLSQDEYLDGGWYYDAEGNPTAW